MTRAAMAPTTTAPTATPIPAIAGAASPPSGEGVGEEVIVVGVSVLGGIVVGLDGVVVVSEAGIKPRGIMPVINQSSKDSRLTVDLCDVEPQYR